MSQRKKEERGARERDRYAEKRSVCGGLFLKCWKIEKAQECCAHTISPFYGFNVHNWRGRTRAGDSSCTEERGWGRYSTEAQHENVLNDIQL